MTEPGSGGFESVGDGGGRLSAEIVTSSTVALVVVGADRRLALANPSARAMLGLSQRDVGRPFAHLAIAHTLARLGAHAVAALEGRGSVSLREVSWREPAGSTIHLDVDMVPLAGEPGNPAGLTITLTDARKAHELRVEVERAHHELRTAYAELRSMTEELTATVAELKATNEELTATVSELEATQGEVRLTHARLGGGTDSATERAAVMRSVLDGLDTPALVVDRGLDVQAWSRQAEELWGLSEPEVLGRPLLTLDTGLSAHLLHPWLVAVAAGEEPGVHGRHVDAVDRRGRALGLRVTVTPMSGAGDVTGVLVLFRRAGVADPS